MAYPPGLPLGMLAVQAWFDRFDEMRLLAVQTAWHTGLLALAWEMVRQRVARISTLPPVVIAWAVILLLLAAEASWTLVPQLLQAEKPQVYFLTSAFLLLMMARLDQEESVAAMLAAGLCLTGAYLIKTTVMAAVPAFLVIAMIEGWRRRRVAPAIAMLLPMAAVWLGWKVLAPAVAGCAAGPEAIFTGIGLEETPAQLAARFLPAVGAYLAGFKPVVSLLAVTGLALGLRNRALRLPLGGLLAYVAVYMVGLYVMYLLCILGYEGQILASLQRYVRLLLRVAHGLGLILLALELLPLLRRPLVLPPRWVVPAAFLLLGLWQIHAIGRSLDNLHDRRHEDDWRQTVLAIRDGAQALRRRLPATDQPPQVVLVAQGSQGGERVMARYEELADRRGGPLRHWRTAIQFSRGPVATNEWMRSGGEAEALAELAAADVLWLVRLDGWVTTVLRRLPLEGGCEPVQGIVLIRRDGRYSCSG